MFEQRKIVREVHLGEYAAAYADAVLYVWVNIPMVLRQERAALMREFLPALAGDVKRFRWARLLWLRLKLGGIQKRLHVMLAQLWSQHEDAETHWTVDEVRRLYEAEPALYEWMVRETTQLLDTWRADKKK